jgi:hypothetical protein
VVHMNQLLEKTELSCNDEKGALVQVPNPFDFLGFEISGGKVLATQERADRWFDKLVGMRRRFRISQPNDGAAFLGALNAEISGVTGRHIPYYSMAENVEIYKNVDRKIARLTGGLRRRLELPPSSVAKAETWLWKYKRNHQKAKELAHRKYG